jgi:hypothetical protein
LHRPLADLTNRVFRSAFIERENVGERNQHARIN